MAKEQKLEKLNDMLINFRDEVEEMNSRENENWVYGDRTTTYADKKTYFSPMIDAIFKELKETKLTKKEKRKSRKAVCQLKKKFDFAVQYDLVLLWLKPFIYDALWVIEKERFWEE